MMATYSDFVLDKSGYLRPIVGASVYFFTTDGTLAVATTNPVKTDLTGRYTITGIAEGLYRAEARLAGVVVAEGPVTIGTEPFRGPPGLPGLDGTPGDGYTLDNFGGARDLVTGGLYGPIVGNPTNNAPAFNAYFAANTYFIENAEYRSAQKLSESAGGRFFASTLEPMAVIDVTGTGGGADNIVGSIWRWAANTVGLRIGNRKTLAGSFNPGTRPTADGSRLSRLYFLGGGGTDQSKDGIRLQGRVILRDVTVDNFAGCAFNSTATALGEPNNTTYGNTNGQYLDRCLSRACKGPAAFLNFGLDANAQVYLACQVKDTANAGFIDNGAYANVHLGFEVDSSGESGKGRVNHNGKNWIASSSDPAVLASVEPGTNYRAWTYYEDQANPSAYWPAWVSGGTYACGLAFISDAASNRGVILGGYSEAGNNGFINIAESSMIALGGEFTSTVDSGHIFKRQQGGDFDNTIRSKLGYTGERDWMQQPPQMTYYGRYSEAGVGIYSPGQGYQDFLSRSSLLGRWSGGWDTTGRNIWRFGRGYAADSAPGVWYATGQTTTLTFGRSTPQIDTMIAPKLAIGNANGDLNGARIVQFVGAQPANDTSKARGEVYPNTEVVAGGSWAWTRLATGIAAPVGIVGATQAAALPSSATAADIVAALKACGLMAS